MISGMAPSSLVADTSRVSEGAMFRQLTTLLAFASNMAEVEPRPALENESSSNAVSAKLSGDEGSGGRLAGADEALNRNAPGVSRRRRTPDRASRRPSSHVDKS